MKTENQKPKTENPAPKPKALVLYGYGLNCDYETAFALSRAGAEAVRVHTTDVLENPGLLWDYHLLAVPGGISWGDDHGAGVILALRLRLALGSALQEFIAAGRLVIGICNGFQVLVNLGLLPGLPGRPERPSGRAHPQRLRQFPRRLGPPQGHGLQVRVHPGPGHSSNCPSATGRGNFTPIGPILAELADRGQIALKYATPSGSAAMGRFPHNPNGSLLDIAGVTDATGRVLGLMPHPEAHISSFQHPTWTRDKETWRRRNEPYPEQVGAGLAIFKNTVRYLEEKL